MLFGDYSKRKTTTSCLSPERPSKRTRMISCSNSDSGRSSMSGNSSILAESCKLLSPIEKGTDQWPLLSLLTNTDEPISNGKNRRRFPDPIYDKAILFACYGNSKKKLKLRLCNAHNTESPNVFVERDGERIKTLENAVERSRIENCSFFLSLDSISIGNTKITAKEGEKNIMLCDVRQHAVASTNVLPEEITGFWVRTFGPRQKFKLQLTLWQVIHKEKRFYKLKKECFSDGHVMKVNELRVEFNNDVSAKPKKTKKEKCNDKSRHVNNLKFGSLSTTTSNNFQPTFCSKEMYDHVTMCLRECIENGKYAMFSEMYNKFCLPLLTCRADDRDSIELKLLLSCEKSQFHAYQGDYVDAKKLLRHVVSNVVSKSPNKTFLINRAYLYLANVHLMEENCGMAEECLNVLQFDKKNGNNSEDITLFYSTYAVALMTFSKKLPQLSDHLRAESLQKFLIAESYLQKSLPISLNRMCWMTLHRARLFICTHYSGCCGSSVSNAMECVKSVEKYGESSLSEKNKCLLKIIKSEISCFQKHYENANRLLDDAENLATRLNFCREKILCGTLRSNRNELLKLLSVNSPNDRNIYSKTICHDVEMDCNIYDADESS